jgi:hypothetical protein
MTSTPPVPPVGYHAPGNESHRAESITKFFFITLGVSVVVVVVLVSLWKHNRERRARIAKAAAKAHARHVERSARSAMRYAERQHAAKKASIRLYNHDKDHEALRSSKNSKHPSHHSRKSREPRTWPTGASSVETLNPNYDELPWETMFEAPRRAPNPPTPRISVWSDDTDDLPRRKCKPAQRSTARKFPQPVAKPVLTRPVQKARPLKRQPRIKYKSNPRTRPTTAKPTPTSRWVARPALMQETPPLAHPTPVRPMPELAARLERLVSPLPRLATQPPIEWPFQSQETPPETPGDPTPEPSPGPLLPGRASSPLGSRPPMPRAALPSPYVSDPPKALRRKPVPLKPKPLPAQVARGRRRKTLAPQSPAGPPPDYPLPKLPEEMRPPPRALMAGSPLRPRTVGPSDRPRTGRLSNRPLSQVEEMVDESS